MTKQYLDEDGLKRLIEYINNSHLSLRDTISQLDVAALLAQEEDIISFYGGSASDVIEGANKK